MGPLVCAFCLFSFPKATAEIELDVKLAVERHFARERRPWSEVAGPYASVRLTLLTPECGVVDGVLTTYGSMTLANSRSVRLIVKQEGNDWRVWTAMR
jgi:hypothetical protein